MFDRLTRTEQMFEMFGSIFWTKSMGGCHLGSGDPWASTIETFFLEFLKRNQIVAMAWSLARCWFDWNIKRWSLDISGKFSYNIQYHIVYSVLYGFPSTLEISFDLCPKHPGSCFKSFYQRLVWLRWEEDLRSRLQREQSVLGSCQRI